MKWKGVELKTMGDMADVIKNIVTKEDATEFMRLYRAENEHANENIGYLTGYFSFEEADRMRSLFDVSHPIFGRKSPTPEQALQAGIEMGRAAKGAKH